MILNNFRSWVKENFMPLLEQKKLSIKIIEGSDVMLGNLYGIEIENNKIGGHIYVWSSKTINYNLFSFENESDVIEEVFIKDLEDIVSFNDILNDYTGLIKELE